MKPNLRAQLRRQKARPKSGLAYWGRSNSITVPWTVGQRKWMQSKIRNSLRALFSSMASKPSPDTLIMSTEVYDALSAELAK